MHLSGGGGGHHQGTSPQKDYINMHPTSSGTYVDSAGTHQRLEKASVENIMDEDYPNDLALICCGRIWRCCPPQWRAWYYRQIGDTGFTEFLYFTLAVCNSCVLALGLLMSYGFEWWMIKKAIGGHVEKIQQSPLGGITVDQVYAVWVLISLACTIILFVESSLEVLLNMCTHCFCCCNPRHSQSTRQSISYCCQCLMGPIARAKEFNDTMESRFMFVRKYFAGLSNIVEPLFAILLVHDALTTAPNQGVTFGVTTSNLDKVAVATQACNASAGTGLAGITEETCAVIGGCELCVNPSNRPIVAGINASGHVSRWAMNRQRWMSFTYGIIAVLYWCMHWVWKRKLAGEEINHALLSDAHGRIFQWTSTGIAHGPVGQHPRPEQLNLVEQTATHAVHDGVTHSQSGWGSQNRQHYNPTHSMHSNTSEGTVATSRARRYQTAYLGKRARREFGEFGTVAILLGKHDNRMTDFDYIFTEDHIGEEAKDLIYHQYPGLRERQRQGHHDPMHTSRHAVEHGSAHPGQAPQGLPSSWSFNNPQYQRIGS